MASVAASGDRVRRVAAIELHRGGPVAYREALPRASRERLPVRRLRARLPGELADVGAADGGAGRGAGGAALAPDLYGLGDSADSGPATFEHSLERFGELDRRARPRAGGARRPRLGRVRRPRLGLRAPRPGRRARDLATPASSPTASGTGWRRRCAPSRARRSSAALDRDGFAGLLRADGAEFSDEATRRLLGAVRRRRPRPAGDARVLPLDGLREARPVRGQARRDRRPDAAALGRRRPVRAARRRAAVRARDSRTRELVAIEGAGHFVFDAEPERCANEVLAFLARPAETP